MPTRIRKLKDKELPEAFALMGDAYPGIGMLTPDDRARRVEMWKSREADERVTFYGAFHDDTMLGVMRLHDYSMNVRGVMVPAGGVGAIAVHLLHKKEHVAKEIMEFYLEHYHQLDYPMAVLWPFRIDFYHNMGFGMGSRMFQYRLLPASLPRFSSRSHLRYLDEKDVPQIAACYNRYARTLSGLIEEHRAVFANRLKFQKQLRVVGYVDDGDLRGYMQFQFDPSVSKNFIKNDLEVTELVYESRDVLGELLEFLRTQADQINRIVFNTPEDEWYFLLSDVRDNTDRMIPSVNHQSHVAGVGIMYRVIDARKLFRRLTDAQFGKDTLTLNIHISDSFFAPNHGAITVRFDDGRPSVIEAANFDAEIRLNVAEFSSMVMGAIRFRELVTYGLAEISNPDYVDRVDYLFATRYKPITLSAF